MQPALAMARPQTQNHMKKAFFLDRDGVINKDFGYVHSWDRFEPFDQTYDALKLIKENGYLIVIVTNQAGIARGYYSESDFFILMEKFRIEAHIRGIDIDGTYYCPHHPQGVVQGLNIECHCRKPNPGLITKAASDLGIKLSESYLIGDKITDIEAGIASKLKESFLIDSQPNLIAKNFESLFQAVKFVLGCKPH